MKHLMTVFTLAAALWSTSAFAAGAACEAQAAEKKLAGAAKASFIKKCEKDSPPPAKADATLAAAPAGGGACEAKADEKKLAGAARNSFVKKCEKDAKPEGAGASCEAQATEKKLAGAARASFVKKCSAG